MAPSPYIGLTILVLVLIILLLNLYFTWWLYDNYRNAQSNLDDAKENIRKIGQAILIDTGLDAIKQPETITEQPKQPTKKGYKTMADFFGSKRSSSA